MILIGLNFFAQLIWIFGFHTERLALLVVTGGVLLGLFFIYEHSLPATILKIIILIMLIMGIENMNEGFVARLIYDLCTFGVISSAFLLKRMEYNQFKLLFNYLLLGSLIYFTYSISFMDFSLIGANVNRVEAFNQYGNQALGEGGANKGYIIYATQQFLVSIFALYLLLYPLYYKKNNIKIAYLELAIILIYVAIFIATYQKRQPLVEFGIIFISFALFYRKLLTNLIPKSRVISLILIFLLIAFGLSLNIFTSTLERFTDSLSNVSSFDRIYEFETALEKFEPINFIFGVGSGSLIEGTIGGDFLHIGYGNLLLKGGIVLLLFYLYQVVYNIVYCIRKVKNYSIFYVGVVISVFSLIQLAFAPGWSWYTTSIITGLAMFSRYPLNSFLYDKYNNTSA